MKCQVCGKEKPLTYRSWLLMLRSVCASCIRAHYPETVTRDAPSARWTATISDEEEGE